MPEVQQEPAGGAPRSALHDCWVGVWETYDPFALSFAKSVLQSAGIPYLSPNENFLRMMGHTSPLFGLSPALGGYSLYVEPEDADAARELLAGVEQRRYFDEDQALED